MHADKKIMVCLVLSILTFLLSGCSVPEKPAAVTPLPGFDQTYQSDSVAKRFDESVSQGPAAVRSAIELSEKYAKLSEEAAALRQKNQSFIAENRRLRDRVTALDAQLQQAQKELTEANDLLREMLIELNNWKTNVIGFREEMRGAEKTQLETLLKICKLLGGEVNAEPGQGQAGPQTQETASGNPNGTGLAALSAHEPAQSQSQSQQIGTIIGEPNE